MNCAWCGANADSSNSHGICDNCAFSLALQSVQRQFDRTSSYIEINAAVFAEECRLILEREAVQV